MDPSSRAESLAPQELRDMVRAGLWSGPTSGCCRGFAQANLVVLPDRHAADFLSFCQANPKPCPLLGRTHPGEFQVATLAREGDLRTDLPAYRVYRHGELVSEPSDILGFWREDLVAFLLGCSFAFEWALLEAGIPVRHIELGRNVPMYVTDVMCRPAGIFKGPMVVSMRPIPDHMVERASEITARLPLAHGAPVQVGKPELIGVRDLGSPDFGDAVPVRERETPVFWACGTTPQAVAQSAKPELMITHAPGHMLVTDMRCDEIVPG